MKSLNFIKIGILLTLIVLHACSTTPSQKPRGAAKPSSDDVTDGPPSIDIDVSNIPNAMPKAEPVSKYGNPRHYEVFGKRYHTMTASKGYQAKGTASWYGKKFHGQRTSSGEKFDMYSMTAAHRSLPLPTYAKVKNLENGREVIVKINDRGPFAHNRLIDLSYAAAKKLGIHNRGTAKVHLTAIDPKEWHKHKKTHLAEASKKAQTKKGPQQQSKKQPSQLAKANTKLPAKGGKQLYVQLGSFNKKMNAELLAKRAETLTHALSDVNIKVFPQKLSNKELFKVRIGPMKSRAAAQKLQKDLVAINGVSKPTLIYE
ncbi:MAG: septal ring lytic transglycosylase RlpA family protein [Candidatus Berkiellales bacterium]